MGALGASEIIKEKNNIVRAKEFILSNCSRYSLDLSPVKHYKYVSSMLYRHLRYKLEDNDEY